MPALRYNLASQRLDTRGGGASASPTLLSGNAVYGLRGGQVRNTNVVYEPMPIPEFVDDKLDDGVQHFGEVLSLAAQAFDMRERQAQADEVVLETNSLMSEQLSGNGEDNPGYGSYKGKEGSLRYSGYAGNITSIAKSQLGKLDPSARQAALLRVKELENVFLTKGAQHKAQQQKVWDDTVEAKLELDIERNIITESDDPEKFTAGVKQYEARLRIKYADRPDFAELKVQDFHNSIYPNVITTRIQSGIGAGNEEEADEHFRLAAEYINNGYAEQVDAPTLAKMGAQLTRAIQTRENRLEQTTAKIEDNAINDYAHRIAVAVDRGQDKYGNTPEDLYDEVINDDSLPGSAMNSLQTMLRQQPSAKFVDAAAVANVMNLASHSGGPLGNNEEFSLALAAMPNAEIREAAMRQAVAVRSDNGRMLVAEARAALTNAYMELNGIDASEYEFRKAEIEVGVARETADVSKFIGNANSTILDNGEFYDTRMGYKARLLKVIGNMRPVGTELESAERKYVPTEYSQFIGTIRKFETSSSALDALDNLYARMSKIPSTYKDDASKRMYVQTVAKLKSIATIEIRKQFKEIRTAEQIALEYAK